MKKNLLNTLLIGGFILGMASCDENAWNNNLDGFDGEQGITNKQTIEYTLTDADYANLAANATNVAKAKELGIDADLKNVGTKHYFTDKVSAKDFVPAFLSDPKFSYFTLSDGSSLKLTYNVAVGLPAEISEYQSATTHKVAEFEYQEVWGSEEDYIEAFSPAKKPASFVGGLLDTEYPDAEAGDYKVVEYKVASQEPVFSAKPEPEFEMSDVLKTAKLGDAVEVKGIISGLCARGYVLSDKGASVLVYYGADFVLDDWAIGDQVELAGTISSFNKGFQIDGLTATATKVGSGKVAYPTPAVWKGADFDQNITITEDQMGVYVKFDCTVSVSGNFCNLLIDGAATAQGSLYQGTAAQKAALVNGEKATVTGWFLSVSGGRFANFIITSVNGAVVNKKHPAKVRKSAVEVATSTEYGLYKFNGSNWKVVNGVDIITQNEYRSMNQSYNNFSSVADADFYLSTFMNTKYPYAKADDTKIVCYNLYTGGTTSFTADQYKYDGSKWVKNDGVVTETNQFVLNKGKWMYDPNVNIVLPAGKAQELSTLYFQTCTDWVWENIDKAKLGVTEKGKGYVTSYGNNEYYCGTSAYQGNVDLRAASARTQYPDGFEGMTDDEVVALMKKRFAEEVMPGALAILHPDAAPIDGIDEVLYTITFGVYTGANAEYTIVYKVVGKGQFEFKSCTWDE